MDLTNDQIAGLQRTQTTYTDVGFEKRLHKPMSTPFQPSDEQAITIEKVSGQVTIGDLDLTAFIKRSGVIRITDIVVDDGQTAVIQMTLTMKFDGYTLAIPRWSVYYPNDLSPENEIGSLVLQNGVNIGIGSLTGVSLYASQNFEPVKNNQAKHVFTVTIKNASGVNDVSFGFRGDWLYFGSLTGEGVGAG